MTHKCFKINKYVRRLQKCLYKAQCPKLSTNRVFDIAYSIACSYVIVLLSVVQTMSGYMVSIDY